MKKFIVFLTLVILSVTGFAQTPGLRWQRTFPNNAEDDFWFMQKTNDNGIIAVGGMDGGFNGTWAEKFNGDGIRQWQKSYQFGYITERAVSHVYNSDGSLVILIKASTWNVYEFLLIKIDKDGNKIWESLLGGIEQEIPSQVIKCSSGGYLVVGNTSSHDGSIPGIHGGMLSVDTWLIRFDEAGGIMWQKALGGSAHEGTGRYEGKGKIVEALDGSIYMTTETASNDWDVTGNHGSRDIWLVKLNSGGAIQWSKCFGGVGDELPVDLKLSPSGELCILGLTTSPELTINGVAQADFYFLRVSQAGDLLFQRSYGSTSGGDGPLQIASVDNEGYVLFGQVNKGDGNVQNIHGTDTYDIWIYKINEAGDIIWQKCVGGPSHELVVQQDSWPANVLTGGVTQTSDGGYLISSTTQLNGGDIPGFHGWVDLLAAKVSATGSLEWAQSLGGSNRELCKGLPIEFGPNEYFFGATTYSNDGDIQQFYGGGDPWLVKLGPASFIKGIVFIDQNSNGIKEPVEPLFSDVKINVSKGQDQWTTLPYNGNFLLSTDTGSFISSVKLEHPYYTITPAQHTSNFTSYFQTDSFSFALQPIPGQKDLTIDISPITPARPGFLMDYVINYKNAGNIPVPSGQILFKKDAHLQYVSSVPAISSSNGDTLKWNFSNLDLAGTGSISLKLRLAPPPAVNIGDSVISTAIITPVAGDVTPTDDTSLVKQFVQGSYDPNDKTETAGIISMAQIAAGDYLNYVIRFQNTGNDLAFNITVRDTLDANLDWSSFEMVGSSHPYQLEIEDGNKLAWDFYNILLADSVHNEPASHGYIAYRIKPKANLVNGNLMKNKASIYFDFNLPVVTNETVTRVGVNAVIIALPLHLLTFDASYQKPDALLEWSTADELNVDRFVIERSNDPVHFVPVGMVTAKGNSNNISRYQFKDGLANTNGDEFYYRLKMVDQDQKFTYSNIQLVKRDSRAANQMVVNPNPVSGRSATAWINFERATTVELGVFDMQGRYRLIGRPTISKGFNVVPIEISGLNPGTYVLQAKADGKFLITRFVVVR